MVLKEYGEEKCKEYWMELKEGGFAELGKPVNAVVVEEDAPGDIMSPSNLDVSADGRMIYGEDVFNRAFSRRDILKSIVRRHARL
jgi:hypothetical protein